MSFVYTLNKKIDETFKIKWVGTETLSSSLITGSTYTLSLTTPNSISGATSLISVSYVVDGILNDNQFLKVYMKYRKAKDTDKFPCGDCIWSDNILIDTLKSNNTIKEYTIDLSGTTGFLLNPNAPLDVSITIFRVDNQSSNPTNVYLSNVSVNGLYNIEYTDDTFIINNNNNEMILKPHDIYKVFSISDFEIVYRGDINSVDIFYRVTQDNGRRYSEWEYLTTENISTYKFNELRFAKIEYLIKKKTNENTILKIYDIILKGNFQNVSANYLKTNLYGLKEDCLTKYLDDTGQSGISDLCSPNYMVKYNPINPMGNDYNYDKDFYTQGLSCYFGNNTTIKEITEWNKQLDGLWNPYESAKINDFYNMLANQTNQILSWEIDYHITDVDQNGIDMFLHEYQLLNVIDVKKVKVLVPDNKFPENTVLMNSFNLDLFDTFEIHILKDEFKTKFGIEKRPMEKDILYFCQINRLYYVKHSHIFRNIMNTGIYYKLILEKYEQKVNYENISKESKLLLDTLTTDTTMNELFGVEVSNDMNKTSNIDQTLPKTMEVYRKSIFSKVIINEVPLYNGDIMVCDGYYDFKNCSNKTVITYNRRDILTKSDNRSIVLWFNFNNKGNLKLSKEEIIKSYFINKKNVFELLNNFDEDNVLGYKINYQNGNIVLQINDEYYKLDNINLTTNIWYQLVININQRQRELDMYLYKRNCLYKIIMMRDDRELASVVNTNTTGYTYLVNMGYKPINNEEQHNNESDYTLLYSSLYENIPVDFTHDIDISIKGSDIKLTNLRIYNDIIPLNSIQNILNQRVIKDANHIILLDNAYSKLYSVEQNPIQRNMFD